MRMIATHQLADQQIVEAAALDAEIREIRHAYVVEDFDVPVALAPLGIR